MCRCHRHRHRRDTIRIVKESEFLEISVVVQTRSEISKKNVQQYSVLRVSVCIPLERSELSKRMNVSVAQCLCERISQRKVC